MVVEFVARSEKISEFLENSLFLKSFERGGDGVNLIWHRMFTQVTENSFKGKDRQNLH